MPTTPPGGKILVTGANGYIALWVVRTLLEKGYAVRGTVRSSDKATRLQEYFKKYEDKLEVLIVEDITAEGAFDEAVKGVDAIEHLASPCNDSVDDPEEFIRPAVDGTVGVLKSALKNNPDAKRIVITSSCSAVITPSRTPATFSENDWNDEAVREVAEQGRKAHGLSKYRASKTLAEKAAWAFYEEHKAKVKWDITILNPPMVFGPPLQELSSPRNLNISMKLWYDMVLAEGPKPREGLSASNSWVDVRDLANAHVLALEKDAAGGERIIISQGPYILQEWVDIANAHSSLMPKRALFKGYPDLENEKVYNMKYDTTKEGRILAIKYRSKEETTKDIMTNLAERGW